ncbi:bifunctional aminoglycoside phosphotransferase/ATP-binding protein [Thiolapillus sp.]
MSRLGDASALIRALMQPALFDHPVENIRLIETHISWVILTGKYVYKIKKPVDLGFLDFSSLEKRRFYCEEEVRLNRRLAADYYLGVAPVTGSTEHPQWGGDGKAIEYAVKMRQFPQEAQLDRMLERGRLEPHYMDVFARLIASFHDQAAVADADSRFGAPRHIDGPVMENFAQLERLVADPEVLQILDRLRDWSQQTSSAMKTVFRQRKTHGFVRECHGDMHLRNMAWVNDQPLVFDCIEFNPDLRWIDVMSEVAFLVMDLHYRQEPELAWRFLNVYLEHGGDYAGLRVLPFYLTYRAMVRAKVAAIRASQDDIDVEGRQVAEQELRAYLQLADQCRAPGQRMLLITRGLSASGKSTLAARLMEKLGAVRIRSDVERKRLFGLAADESGKTGFGEGIYSPKAGEKTYERLLELAEVVLDAGFPVIVDAAFLQAQQREPFQLLAARKHLPYVILQLEAPKEMLRNRILRRKNDVSDADLSVLEQQLKSWRDLEAGEQAQAIRIDMQQEPDFARLLRQIQRMAN